MDLKIIHLDNIIKLSSIKYLLMHQINDIVEIKDRLTNLESEAKNHGWNI